MLAVSLCSLTICVTNSMSGISDNFSGSIPDSNLDISSMFLIVFLNDLYYFLEFHES